MIKPRQANWLLGPTLSKSPAKTKQNFLPGQRSLL
jgi:hypothetical protein